MCLGVGGCGERRRVQSPSNPEGSWGGGGRRGRRVHLAEAGRTSLAPERTARLYEHRVTEPAFPGRCRPRGAVSRRREALAESQVRGATGAWAAEQNQEGFSRASPGRGGRVGLLLEKPTESSRGLALARDELRVSEKTLPPCALQHSRRRPVGATVYGDDSFAVNTAGRRDETRRGPKREKLVDCV